MHGGQAKKKQRHPWRRERRNNSWGLTRGFTSPNKGGNVMTLSFILLISWDLLFIVHVAWRPRVCLDSLMEWGLIAPRNPGRRGGGTADKRSSVPGAKPKAWLTSQERTLGSSGNRGAEEASGWSCLFQFFGTQPRGLDFSCMGWTAQCPSSGGRMRPTWGTEQN